VTEGRPVGAVVAWSSEVSFSLTLVADRLAEDELVGHVCSANRIGVPAGMLVSAFDHLCRRQTYPS
jgi:hypothetical protein